jgi:hypothetical protein
MFNPIESKDFKINPFPYVIKDNFMEDHYFNALILELEEIEKMKRRVWSGDKDKLADPAVWPDENDSAEEYPIASKVIKHLRSNAFYAPMIKEWSDYFPRRHGVTVDFVNKNLSKIARSQIWLDAAGKYVKIREPHVDNHKSIITFLYYCRLPEDSSTGGDLTTYSLKKGFRGFKLATLKDSYYFNDKDIKLEETIRYKPNRLVVTLNGKNAIHGITPRQNATVSRIKFIGCLNSEHARIDESLENAPIWKIFYYPLRFSQKALIKGKKTFFGSTPSY